ncbi:MAG: hypothetical protein ALECFALPRED_009481 [Alectoria fallacina]|uniref:Uncharacterized protein n=1 Tax=Alectoria fallacina TaxID=1903189 RepID=A0A8H3PIF0_9LECA|nr:MAG: hypothetical protein ALECFALPRED_009481 [Alectoria fallacina]
MVTSFSVHPRFTTFSPLIFPVLERAPSVTTIDGRSIQIAPSRFNVILVDGQPTIAGISPTTVSSTHIVLHNGDLILGASTIHTILPSAPPAPLSHFTIGSQTITLISSHILAASTAHAAGDAGFAVDKTPISLGSSVLHIIGTSTMLISPLTPPLPAIVTTAVGHLFTLLPSGVVVAGITFTANTPAVTVSSALLSYGAAGFAAGPPTIPLILPINLLLTPSAVFTTQGQTFAALPFGAIAVAGIPLTSNAPAITFAGVLVSLGADGPVNGTATMSLPSIDTASPTGGLGGFIYSGMNGGSNGIQTHDIRLDGNLAIFFGGADGIALNSNFLIGLVMLVWLCCVR